MAKTKTKTKTKTMFMHTVRGLPAYYNGQQIVIASHGRWARKGIRMRETIDLIKLDQQTSVRWRRACGFSNDQNKYGYVRVEVPDAH